MLTLILNNPLLLAASLFVLAICLIGGAVAAVRIHREDLLRKKFEAEFSHLQETERTIKVAQALDATKRLLR